MEDENNKMENETYNAIQSRLFNNIIEVMVDKTMDDVKIEDFRTIMENIELLKQKPRKIYNAHSIFNENLKKSIMQEFKECMEEDDLDNKFCKLNELNSANCNKEEVKWRPPGNVTEHLKAHLINIKLKQISDLQLYLKEKDESINTLKDKIKTVRNEANNLNTIIMKLRNHLAETSIEDEESLFTYIE